ncbi:predicted protein [Nematostella vectensis]|uniref:non-specific serine/threonine protein kinase n=1 Tax=Nematostella vectensis TaxID=45351 RepID=A7SR42_NEMVE|nr:predicted protein [Nematostella vectensis]|eukprot:XP_001625925.1 predicted protein [Nematostella vectensis]
MHLSSAIFFFKYQEAVKIQWCYRGYGFGNSEAGELLTQFPELKDIFTVVSKVGEGTFSNVYLAKMHDFPDEFWALKHIIPTSGPERIENELKCLQIIGGKDNIIGVEMTYRRNDHIVFVLPYFPHQKFQDYMLDMSVCEIREYIRNLFIALKRVHSFQVIHRDVKPSNFLYCRQSKRDLLAIVKTLVTGLSNGKYKSTAISPKSSKLPTRRSTRLSPQIENKDLDYSATGATLSRANTRPALEPRNDQNIIFTRSTKNFKSPGATKTKKSSRSPSRHGGVKPRCAVKHSPDEICATCISRAHQNTPRAGTPGFRSPEVLLKCPDQTTAVDIWSAGIVFLCALSGRYPFFRAQDDMTALAQIISLIGSSESIHVANDQGKDVVMSEKCPTGSLKSACQRLRQGCSKTQTSKCILRGAATMQGCMREGCSKTQTSKCILRGAATMQGCMREGEQDVEKDSGDHHHLDREGHKLSKRFRRRSPNMRDTSVDSENSIANLTNDHDYCAMCKISNSKNSTQNSSSKNTDKDSTPDHRISHACKGTRSQAGESCSSKKLNSNNSAQGSETSRHECHGVRQGGVHMDGSACMCCRCCWAVPDSAYDLLERCLDLNPSTRITASEALSHPFFQGEHC